MSVKRGVGVGAGVDIFLKKNAVLGLGLGLGFGVGVRVKLRLTVRDMRVGIRKPRPQGFSLKKWVEKPWGRGYRIRPGKGGILWRPRGSQSGQAARDESFSTGGFFLFLRALIEP